jgi:hypothetical protein
MWLAGMGNRRLAEYVRVRVHAFECVRVLYRAFECDCAFDRDHVEKFSNV